MPKAPQLVTSPYLGRDDSWLTFNERVLQEAQDPSNPLLERVKFLAITASNLDEFVEIRLAGLLQRIEDSQGQAPPHEEDQGLPPEVRFERLSAHLQAFVAAQYTCWNDLLIPALAEKKIHVLEWNELDKAARAHALHFYQNEVDPLLTPVTIDPSHPFPRVLNKALCLALLLRRKRAGRLRTAVTELGVVTVPRSLPRLVTLPAPAGEHRFIFLHHLIQAQAETMFRGYTVLSGAAFRVTRNSNLYLQEEESRSVLESVRAELHNRRKGDAVRLEIEASADPDISERLRINFELDPPQVFSTDGPVNLSRLMNLYTAVPDPGLKYPPFDGTKHKPATGVANIFEEIRRHDILLHHPFDSYDTVVSFIEDAATDPAVVSIKQTLYRTSADSSIFQELVEAAQVKDVTVVVELMARFDEASNIRWARMLEDAGVQVFHGILGLKTHCKLALIIRRDEDGELRRYAHLGTGNYNPVTARFYTDISLLTADPAITAAVHNVFNYLTAHAEAQDFLPLLVAPLTLAGGIVALIERETEHARAGRPARIIAKMNSLLDHKVIDALYTASQAGVSIDLIIRGICALRPGVSGMSENISVRSVVGRFLEHSRITLFGNGGDEEIYCGSADWMPRNLYERCETLFPITNPAQKTRLRDEILASYLADNVKARLLDGDGIYHRAAKGGTPFNAQDFLIRLTEGSATIAEIPAPALQATHKPPVKRAAKRTA
ncbi:MAG TPA: polyphosphate kinase 1 [Acidobacteriaceae bacterium]|jgi:polyphosphate kinase|nr:polyphosphate kinase 1 [Acidobacteriaceae bacterium]